MNIGIIGFGVQGKIRFNSVKEIGDKDFKVIKISDLQKPNMDLCPEVKFVEDYYEILNDKNIDIVFVCTPNNLTKDIIIEALNSGKHVFSEKPPGRNIDELEQIIEAEKKSCNKKLMFGFNHRHHDSVLYAKKVVDSLELGEILWMRGRYGKSVTPDFLNTWRAKKEIAGGGIFLDQGIHMLDLFLMMVGDFDEVKAYVSNLFWNLDVEDNVFAIFKNKKGQVASLHSTMTQWRHLFSFEIFLEKGHIVINGLLTSSGSYGKERLSIAKNKLVSPAVQWSKEENITYDINTSWNNEMRMFFQAIRDDKPIEMCGSVDAYKLMRLVDKVYKQGD